jgi:mannose-6-phosphate isomerase class I
MRSLKLSQAEEFNNSGKCRVLEYNLKEPDINCAITTIKGRYPDSGYSVNKECKSIIYIIDGDGTLNKEDEEIKFNKGDMVFIDKGEKYYWNANCTASMSCTPAWYPEQYTVTKG